MSTYATCRPVHAPRASYALGGGRLCFSESPPARVRRDGHLLRLLPLLSLSVDMVTCMHDVSESRGLEAPAVARRHDEHLLGLDHGAPACRRLAHRRRHRPAGWSPPALPAARLGGGRQAGDSVVGVEADGEEGVDGAVVGEAGLAALVPLLLHALAAPQDAVAPAIRPN